MNIKETIQTLTATRKQLWMSIVAVFIFGSVLQALTFGLTGNVTLHGSKLAEWISDSLPWLLFFSFGPTLSAFGTAFYLLQWSPPGNDLDGSGFPHKYFNFAFITLLAAGSYSLGLFLSFFLWGVLGIGTWGFLSVGTA